MTDPHREFFRAVRAAVLAGNDHANGGKLAPPQKRRLRARLERTYAEAEHFERLLESCPYESGQIEVEGGYQPDPVGVFSHDS